MIKKYFFLFFIVASFAYEASSSVNSEISEQDIKNILLTKSYTIENRGTYRLQELELPFEEFLNSLSDIKAKVIDSSPSSLSIQCFSPKNQEEYRLISMDEAFSYDEEFAKKYIVYKYNVELGYGGNYYLKSIAPLMDTNGEPVFEEVCHSLLLFLDSNSLID